MLFTTNKQKQIFVLMKQQNNGVVKQKHKNTFMDQTLWTDRTRLLFYEHLWYFDYMNPQDVFYVGKKVQIMYRSINNSKICPKLTKPIDRMDRIWTAYLLCTRITLETTALRVKCVQILYSSINNSKSIQSE